MSSLTLFPLSWLDEKPWCASPASYHPALVVVVFPPQSSTHPAAPCRSFHSLVSLTTIFVCDGFQCFVSSQSRILKCILVQGPHSNRFSSWVGQITQTFDNYNNFLKVNLTCCLMWYRVLACLWQKNKQIVPPFENDYSLNIKLILIKSSAEKCSEVSTNHL